VDCTLVHFGELWPTFQKVHQSTWEDVTVGFLHSDVSARLGFRTLPHRQFVRGTQQKLQGGMDLQFCKIFPKSVN
jgi:hypothetical protein